VAIPLGRYICRGGDDVAGRYLVAQTIPRVGSLIIANSPTAGGLVARGAGLAFLYLAGAEALLAWEGGPLRVRVGAV
jgi:hypothetical protein